MINTIVIQSIDAIRNGMKYGAFEYNTQLPFIRTASSKQLVHILDLGPVHVLHRFE